MASMASHGSSVKCSFDAAVRRERTYDMFEPEDMGKWPEKVLGPHPLCRFWAVYDMHVKPAPVEEQRSTRSGSGEQFVHDVDRARRGSSYAGLLPAGVPPAAPAALCRVPTPDPYEPPAPWSWQSEVLGPLPALPSADTSRISSGSGNSSAASTWRAALAHGTLKRERFVPPQGVSTRGCTERQVYVPPHRKGLDREAREATATVTRRHQHTLPRTELAPQGPLQDRPVQLKVSAASWDRPSPVDRATSCAPVGSVTLADALAVARAARREREARDGCALAAAAGWGRALPSEDMVGRGAKTEPNGWRRGRRPCARDDGWLLTRS